MKRLASFVVLALIAGCSGFKMQPATEVPQASSTKQCCASFVKINLP